MSVILNMLNKNLCIIVIIIFIIIIIIIIFWAIGVICSLDCYIEMS